MTGVRTYTPHPIYRHTDPITGLIVPISAAEIRAAAGSKR